MASTQPIRLGSRSPAWRLSLGLGALVVLGLCLVPAGRTRSEALAGSWKQVDDDDGIKVWRLEIPGREFPGFRGETVISASAERIVSVLKRVEQHTQWMHRCSASEIIQRFDDDHVVIYNRTDTPWPVWDRDAILDTFFTRSTDDKLITLTFQNADPSRRALPENVVRMPRLVGYYKMWRLGPEQTKVVYQVEVDIGGSVPRFIAERVARDMPYETLARLRARVTGAK